MSTSSSTEDSSLCAEEALLRFSEFENNVRWEGYDEYFDPPLENKYECPICLLGLREPMQTTCGHRFCRDCILRSMRDAGHKCPVDNVHLDERELHPDNFAKREMLNSPVFCRWRKLFECPWKGPLSKLEDHLEECDFADVSCPKNCGKKFQRKDLKKHLEDDCPNRTISRICPEALWGRMEGQDHKEKDPYANPFAEPKCPLNPLTSSFEGTRPAVNEHDEMLSIFGFRKVLGKVNPLQAELPPLRSRFPFSRGELEAQERPTQGVLLRNLATLCQQQQTEIDGLRGLVNELKDTVKSLEGRLNEMRVEILLQGLASRLNHQDVRTLEVKGFMDNGSYICSIENYLQRRQEAINCTGTAIHGPAFYTHPNGYKMCLGINLNGTDSGVGRYIALFVHMMPGDYDNRIKWPFTPRRITFTILDQSEDTESPRRQHISKSLNAESNLLTFQRPTAPGINSGVGFVEFAPIELIREPRYFENNTMKVRIQIEQSED